VRDAGGQRVREVGGAPTHKLCAAMISRTQAATNSASIMPSIAALRLTA
jgi:hypothetical protein